MISNYKPENCIRNKKGQLSIFVIIAIAILAGVIIYFIARGVGPSEISGEMGRVFSYYESCIEDETRGAIELAGSQGGYIEVPEYAPGSEYAPFSSEMNFLGFSIPYWYYISGNGVIKEQVPSINNIEDEIARYVEDGIANCNFDNFYSQGYEIEIGEPSADVSITERKVEVNVNSNLAARRGEESARKTSYNVEINSKIGKYYNIAKKIYEKEKTEAFLDNYAADVLRLYAPVDGVEISCSGKTWKTQDVFNDLTSGLEANIGQMKFKGNYYSLQEDKNKYFVVELGENIDEQVNLVYSKTMPTKIEITGEDVSDNLLIARPVGIQEGLGVLGFCYSPYHYVYDVNFPILVQIYDANEIFQFPVVAIVDNNLAREAVFSELEAEAEVEDLCDFKTEDIEINLYDINLNSADAEISYQCFDTRCDLGKSENGKLSGKAPSCLNGQLIARGEGYAEKKVFFSSNKENSADIVLDREHEVEIELLVGDKALDGTAIVSFDRDGGSTSTALPESKSIKLSEGNYEVSVYVYGNSSINIPATKKTECHEVPRAGILSFFGGTKEECFDINVPATKIDFALRGGGKGEAYILDEQLESGKLKISVDSLPLPKSLEELQLNYAAFESSGVFVE